MLLIGLKRMETVSQLGFIAVTTPQGVPWVMQVQSLVDLTTAEAKRNHEMWIHVVDSPAEIGKSKRSFRII
jgi:hypothetical protein